jgi:hypothetical protein
MVLTLLTHMFPELDATTVLSLYSYGHTQTRQANTGFPSNRNNRNLSWYYQKHFGLKPIGAPRGRQGVKQRWLEVELDNALKMCLPSISNMF